MSLLILIVDKWTVWKTQNALKNQVLKFLLFSGSGPWRFGRTVEGTLHFNEVHRVAAVVDDLPEPDRKSTRLNSSHGS